MLPNIGWGELLVILLVVLLLFGAKRLPEIGKALGRSIGAFKEGLKDGEQESKASEDKEKK
ncbi:MAG: twin-arginine translocase TatA/TatE family subunit [Elusimicrobia bacterium]|nr:twin-arginine translocase TatA/TatE family subunit [Elusimicrobiota bacterium]